MWIVIKALCKKDITLILARGSGLIQALLLGLLVIFVFSMSQGAGETLSAQSCATIFWISSLFCEVLLFTQLYALEENNLSRVALVLLPVPSQSVWLAKTCSGFFLLVLAQLFFFPALLVFLGQNLQGSFLFGLLGLLLVDIGMCSLGSFLGACCQGQVAKESLISILLFPLLTPLLLSGIGIHTETLSGQASDLFNWISIAASFDAIFFSLSCFLFSFIYTGEDA